MKIAVRFSNGERIEVIESRVRKDFIKLIERSKNNGKTISFENPTDGSSIQRDAKDIVMLEVIFD
ncbi:hypothetical protein [Virgibacillus senegalensis]|uniref:hypothetical protein n=1 Tax=Virgibacillus senegalensis TaxID=1499679 RepID=UPI00069CDB50|nr:hypothetical protein [Virgibacillus senegalensis]